jgi:hypothetical protein
MRTRSLVTIVAVAASLLAACAEVPEADEETHEPAQLVAVEGSDQEAIVVEPAAVDRVGIATEPVADGAAGTTMPAAAVYYGTDGATWAYTNTDPNTYLRVPITVADIQGDTAYVTDGPAAGTQVVVVGLAELFGVEEGVGH